MKPMRFSLMAVLWFGCGAQTPAADCDDPKVRCALCTDVTRRMQCEASFEAASKQGIPCSVPTAEYRPVCK